MVDPNKDEEMTLPPSLAYRARAAETFLEPGFNHRKISDQDGG